MWPISVAVSPSSRSNNHANIYNINTCMETTKENFRVMLFLQGLYANPAQIRNGSATHI